MNNVPNILAQAAAIGMGATMVMDLWAMLLRRGFGVASLDMALLGRWIGHLPRGRVRHRSIAQAAPVNHERVLGWMAHYSIGVTFAVLLLAVVGPQWLDHPTLMQPLTVAYATLAAPFLVMQPAMGSGIASSRTPRPNVARLRSVATHTVYGIGLYAAAWARLLLVG